MGNTLLLWCCLDMHAVLVSVEVRAIVGVISIVQTDYCDHPPAFVQLALDGKRELVAVPQLSSRACIQTNIKYRYIYHYRMFEPALLGMRSCASTWVVRFFNSLGRKASGRIQSLMFAFLVDVMTVRGRNWITVNRSLSNCLI